MGGIVRFGTPGDFLRPGIGQVNRWCSVFCKSNVHYRNIQLAVIGDASRDDSIISATSIVSTGSCSRSN